ncbi:MAG: GNAT family N-acetyltransferase, partial [Sandaracinaceae bacterium]|nr:GNAT family N-acetyltransferase [Sandaracinaceae bacterium]
ITVLADRGRGKSSALGLALARLPPETDVVVTAESEGQAAEIFRFAEGRGRFRAISELLHHDERPEVLVVDEAAQIPVFVLERLAVRFPQAKIAFATTARGYEGTGRGFVLRFLAWARRQPRPLHCHELHAPIRWDEGDPLERFVLDVLALDAEPAEPPEGLELRCELLDRDALDETRLREVFGLLVHAHYRTTPSDLHRMLDAPNLAVHVATIAGRVVGASLIAREGGLPEALCDRLARGRERVHGHALPDTLITHSGRPEAGTLQMVRSVRIAVHPAARLRGIARALVDHVHATYDPDLFGTLFGATPELLSFRRALGYRLVRVGMSRGRRSGEPAAVMVRPVSPRAVALVDELRASLAWNLPAQCELLDRDLALDPALAASFREDLPHAPEPTPEQVSAAVRRYVSGPQPSDAVAWALERWVRSHPAALAALDAKARAIVEGRVLDRRAWTDLGAPVPWAMRALRPAMARLFEAAG